jgi:hypothetical protein
MALAPMSAATKPITTKGLFNAAGAGGQTYEQWRKSAGATEAMPSIAPAQVDDSVTNRVNAITSQSSPLMQAARTEGLKVANRRGLLNSSIAAGATQRAMLDAALPIAQQESAQDFQRNQDARNFEYGMAGQDSAQEFQSGQSALDRALQTDMQIRDIASREGLAAAERALQEKMQKSEIAYQQAERKLDRQLQEKLASWNLSATDRNAAAQFLTNMETMYQSSFEAIMANTALSAKDRSAQLASAKALRDKQLNFVQQMYNVKLTW